MTFGSVDLDLQEALAERATLASLGTGEELEIQNRLSKTSPCRHRVSVLRELDSQEASSRTI